MRFFGTSVAPDDATRCSGIGMQWVTPLLIGFANFAEWQQHHGRQYASPADEATAEATWRSNHAQVLAHNARAANGEVSYTVSMRGPFADLTNAQYREKILRPVRRSRQLDMATQPPQKRASNTAPTSWNWYDHGVVTPVKDQGNCGSCWSFSAVAAIETAFNIALKNSTLPQACRTQCGKNTTKACCSFSEQQVADCTLSGADLCTIGGEPHDGVLNVVKNGGRAATELQYPYTSGKTGKLSSCKKPSTDWVATGVSGYVNVTSGDEDALVQATYEHGTISVGIDASSFGFQLYSSGVYNDSDCGNKLKNLDHGVAVVGYGKGNPTPPGPTPPPPGPSDCKDNHYKAECTGEKGCFWCHDTHISWCQAEACDSQQSLAEPRTDPFPVAAVAGARGTDQDYWMVKNSWGLNWGMGGFIAMRRNRENMCGIATDAIYVTMS